MAAAIHEQLEVDCTVIQRTPADIRTVMKNNAFPQVDAPRKLLVNGTARNWNTVTKLAASDER